MQQLHADAGDAWGAHSVGAGERLLCRRHSAALADMELCIQQHKRDPHEYAALSPEWGSLPCMIRTQQSNDVASPCHSVHQHCGKCLRL